LLLGIPTFYSISSPFFAENNNPIVMIITNITENTGNIFFHINIIMDIANDAIKTFVEKPFLVIEQKELKAIIAPIITI